MIPWSNMGRLPDDMQPERVEPDPNPNPNPNPKPKVEDEILLTSSPDSPPGYEPAPEPPVRINYGRGPKLRWGHRKVR